MITHVHVGRVSTRTQSHTNTFTYTPLTHIHTLTLTLALALTITELGLNEKLRVAVRRLSGRDLCSCHKPHNVRVVRKQFLQQRTAVTRSNTHTAQRESVVADNLRKFCKLEASHKSFLCKK